MTEIVITMTDEEYIAIRKKLGEARRLLQASSQLLAKGIEYEDAYYQQAWRLRELIAGWLKEAVTAAEEIDTTRTPVLQSPSSSLSP